MIVYCHECRKSYNDASNWTICPHVRHPETSSDRAVSAHELARRIVTLCCGDASYAPEKVVKVALMIRGEL
jgi:hypothetical protein